MGMGINGECLDKANNCKSLFILDQYFWQKTVNISFVFILQDVILNQHLLLCDLWKRRKHFKVCIRRSST